MAYGKKLTSGKPAKKGRPKGHVGGGKTWRGSGPRPLKKK